jgi:hypothetical protein
MKAAAEVGRRMRQWSALASCRAQSHNGGNGGERCQWPLILRKCSIDGLCRVTRSYVREMRHGVQHRNSYHRRAPASARHSSAGWLASMRMGYSMEFDVKCATRLEKCIFEARSSILDCAYLQIFSPTVPVCTSFPFPFQPIVLVRLRSLLHFTCCRSPSCRRITGISKEART